MLWYYIAETICYSGKAGKTVFYTTKNCQLFYKLLIKNHMFRQG